MSVFDRIRSAFTGPKANALMGNGSRAYEAGRYDMRELSGWVPTVNNPHEEVLGSRDVIVGRARDLVKNNPTVAGAIDRLCESVIGANMWPESEPDYEAMGRKIEWAFEYAVKAEARYRVWSNDIMRRCDYHGVSRVPEIYRAAYRHWLIDGEACAVIRMVDNGTAYGTCIELIDPDRLSNPPGVTDEQRLPNGNTCIGGVEINARGAPVAYHIKKFHPSSGSPDNDGYQWVRIERYAPSGRQQFIHAFRKDRADQRRGVSRLAGIMVETKMAGKYSAAELSAALFDALNVGFIKSNLPDASQRAALAPTDDGDEKSYLEGLVDYNKANRIAMDGLRMWNLFPEQEAQLFKPTRPAQHYPDFMADRDRRIAAGLGMTYPRYANNWADINYSSGKLMENAEWRGFYEDRTLFMQEFGTPIWSAVMEEQVMRGELKVPGGPSNFYRFIGELTPVHWMGPGPGYGDPKKEAEANALELSANTITHSDIGAVKGVDARKTFVKRAFHKAFQERLGLTDVADMDLNPGPGRPDEGASDAGSGTDSGQRDGEGQFAPGGKPKKKGGSK